MWGKTATDKCTRASVLLPLTLDLYKFDLAIPHTATNDTRDVSFPWNFGGLGNRDKIRMEATARLVGSITGK